MDSVTVPLELRLVVMQPEVVRVGDTEPLTVPLVVPDTVLVPHEEALKEGVEVRHRDTERVKVVVLVMEGDRVELREPLGEGVAEGERVGERDCVRERVVDTLTVTLYVTVGDCEVQMVAVVEVDRDKEGDLDWERLLVRVAHLLTLGERVREGEREEVPAPLGVRVREDKGEGLLDLRAVTTVREGEVVAEYTPVMEGDPVGETLVVTDKVRGEGVSEVDMDGVLEDCSEGEWLVVKLRVTVDETQFVVETDCVRKAVIRVRETEGEVVKVL